MPAPTPIWQRILGALCGIAILAGLLLYFRYSGTSGETVQEWQGVIVVGAAIAFMALTLLKRRGE